MGYAPTTHDKDILYNSLLALSRMDSIVSAANHILDTLFKMDDIDICGFYLKVPESNTMRLVSERNASEELVSTVFEYDLNNSPLILQSLQENRPVYNYHANVFKDIDKKKTGALKKEGIKSLGIIPISWSGMTISALSIASWSVDEFSGRSLWLSERLANDMSLTIKRIIDEDMTIKDSNDYEELFQKSINMLFVCDLKGNILFSNTKATEKLGYTGEELKNINVFDLHPHGSKDQVLEIIGAMAKDRGRMYELPCMTKDGGAMPLYHKMTPSKWGDTEVIICEIADKSDLIERGRLLWHKRKMNQILVNASESVSSREEVNFDDILSKIGSTIRADRAYIFMFRNSMSKLDNTNEWCSEGFRSRIASLQGIDCDPGAWWVRHLDEGKIINIFDVDQIPEEGYKERDALKREGIKSIIVAPLLSSNELLGFMGFEQNRHIRRWNEDDISVLKVVAHTIGHYHNRMKLMNTLLDEKNKIMMTNMALEEFTSSLFHEMQTPLVTVNAYIEELNLALKNQDPEEVQKCMDVIRRSVANISSNSSRLGNIIRTREKSGLGHPSIKLQDRKARNKRSRPKPDTPE